MTDPVLFDLDPAPITEKVFSAKVSRITTLDIEFTVLSDEDAHAAALDFAALVLGGPPGDVTQCVTTTHVLQLQPTLPLRG